MPQYYKLLNKEKNHHGFQYVDGLNVDIHKFDGDEACRRGLYFTRLTNFLHWLSCFPNTHWVYEVSFPAGAKWTDYGDKGKADKIIIGNPKTVEEFLQDNFYIVEELICNGWLLKYVTNPTENMCLSAVRCSGQNLEYISNQTPEMCEIALDQYVEYIKYINFPTDEMWERVLSIEPKVFWMVKNPSRELCLIAVEIDGLNLKYVEDQDEEICLAAIRNNYRAYKYVEDKTPAIDRETLEQLNSEKDE